MPCYIASLLVAFIPLTKGHSWSVCIPWDFCTSLISNICITWTLLDPRNGIQLGKRRICWLMLINIKTRGGARSQGGQEPRIWIASKFSPSSTDIEFIDFFHETESIVTGHSRVPISPAPRSKEKRKPPLKPYLENPKENFRLPFPGSWVHICGQGGQGFKMDNKKGVRLGRQGNRCHRCLLQSSEGGGGGAFFNWAFLVYQALCQAFSFFTHNFL